MNKWWLIIILGSLTSLMRIVPALMVNRGPLNPSLRQFMAYIPLTIFTCLVATDLFFWQGDLALNPLVNLKLIPGLVAGLVAYYRKDIMATMVAGTLAFAVCYYLLG
ncbi:hypothetical protein AWM75_07495 [Aerococcus urinaehominis]|uniref:Uncharacterized protein n=1 Tax=Aerococcus urinaehominis TaxID=128944 RepID=A0A0X8FNB9_9LACT|nr:AzlD domain-containing protein [Aerococcus urinaehominis]AMB99817.1 hypothetical protein AWM75_07495 [Aerococcus urinaehominis]SDM60509.1 Branched-chain amino acid transport protein [Aerococcus urinaehominis]